MRLEIQYGYKLLVGGEGKKYDEVLKLVPREDVVKIISVLNNELKGKDEFAVIQKRILGFFRDCFTEKEKAAYDSIVLRYKELNKRTNEVIFFRRRYLVETLLFELNSQRETNNRSIAGSKEFLFFIAYLQIVDLVNERDTPLEKGRDSSDNKYELVWTTLVRQYFYNETINPSFEYFKLLGLIRYIKERYRLQYFNYINSLGFKNSSEFLYSLIKLTIPTSQEKDTGVFRKLLVINPESKSDTYFLDGLSLNNNLSDEKRGIKSLKSMPLYKMESGQFLILDNDFMNQGFYSSFFFDFFKKAPDVYPKFEDYSTEIGKKVLEEICFFGVMQILAKKNKHVKIEFEKYADCVIIYGKAAIVFEFKAYLFPERFSESPSYEEIKKYIDHRFIENERKRPKGINQLISAVKSIREDYGDIEIIPVICYTDFMFSMQCIESYLNERFDLLLAEKNVTKKGVQAITLINFSTLYSLVSRGCNFQDLKKLIIRYKSIIKNRRNRSDYDKSPDVFLSGNASFDEIYDLILYKDFKNKTVIYDSTAIVGFTQNDLDESIN